MSKKLVIFLMSGKQDAGAGSAAVEGGADLIELGFPFSDPLADGPVIRHAAERALAEGMRTKACLECLAEIRGRVQVPLVPFVYSALLEAYGQERFVADARAAGAGAILVPDLPVDVHPELQRIQLVAPTSTDERIRLAAETTDGWLYLVTLTGTTGARSGALLGARRAGARAPVDSPHRGCRSTPVSASRRRSRRAPRPSSPTASSSARARSRSPTTVRKSCAVTSPRCVQRSMASRPRRRRAVTVCVISTFVVSRFIESPRNNTDYTLCERPRRSALARRDRRSPDRQQGRRSRAA